MQRSKRLLRKPISKIAFLPIKPIYANRLMAGDKLFEFRRSAISTELSHIIVYACSPKQRIIGVLEVNSVEADNPQRTWRRTKDNAGIDRLHYDEYFVGTDVAYCIEIDPGNILRFSCEFHPTEIEKDFRIPQSFKYVDQNILDAAMKIGLR